MGLENLKSVFNDLSENQISNPSKLTPHASRLDDIEDNLISDPNPRAGMLHGILTEGDQYVFELPNPPDKKPLTGRDTSDYNDILKHSTIDPKSGLHSPVSDLSQDSDSFTTLPFPKIDSVFANKSIRLRGGESLIDTEIEHKFGFSTHSDINKLSPIAFRQEDSPQTKQERIEITAEEIKINKVSETEEGGLFQILGVNTQLGKGVFNWSSLYNSNHTPILERIPIDTGRSDKDGKAILLNTLRSGMGTLGNLDIMGYNSGKLKNFRGFDRGDEPYIIKPIGSKDYTTLTNRDTSPLNRALDDVSRLGKFYESEAGKQSIFNENITNILIGNSTQPFRTDTFLLRPFANPIQGNTGFLNFTNQFRNLGNTVGSLRKPTTIEYSSRHNIGLPFGKLGDRITTFLGIDLDVPKITSTPFFGLGVSADNLKKGGSRNNTVYVDNLSKYDAVVPLGISKDDEPPPLEEANLIKKGDFYVRFKDLRNNKFIYFRGFVTGITENVNPSWQPTNYVGRSEPVYLYERAERDLSFNLRLYPFNKNEFEKMYEKINYLTSLAYPEYLPELDNAAAVRMKAPFTELYMGHIGSRDIGQFGFIKSITYTVNESGDWDAETNLPRLIDVAITYQILSKKPPSLKFTQPTADSPDSFYPAYKKL
jgi:hypothetical protein